MAILQRFKSAARQAMDSFIAEQEATRKASLQDLPHVSSATWNQFYDSAYKRRVVAHLPTNDSTYRYRHLLHCGHVVLCNGAFRVTVEIHCPQCEQNAATAAALEVTCLVTRHFSLMGETFEVAE